MIKRIAISVSGLLLILLAVGALFLFQPARKTEAASSAVITIDGSSTVYPITEAVAEEFGKVNRAVKVVVGISGTGGGFKRFCRRETDISDASRPIKQSELDLAKQNGVSFIELPIAYDGIAVVVNKQNTWCKNITVAEPKKLWAPEAKGVVMKWSQVRKGWPDQPIHLFGPGVDSGTFDYFTEAICGKSGSSRPDFTASEDDNVLVQGVARDKYALGYFGLAYYEENMDKLNVVAVDSGRGPVAPSPGTITSGKYDPLARPLFIYVRVASLQRPEVGQFVEFYLKNARTLAKEVGYVPLPDEAYTLVLQRLKNRTPGTVFGLEENKGKSVLAVLRGK